MVSSCSVEYVLRRTVLGLFTRIPVIGQVVPHGHGLCKL